MRVLAFDPGKTNFGYAVLEDGKFVESGFVDPVHDLQFEAFDLGIESLIIEHEPEALIAERFMIRGGRGAAAAVTAEVVNLMIGRISRICSDFSLPYYLITPAQWKAYVKKQEQVPEFPTVNNEHQLDACLMAWYGEVYWIPKQSQICKI